MSLGWGRGGRCQIAPEPGGEGTVLRMEEQELGALWKVYLYVKSDGANSSNTAEWEIGDLERQICHMKRTEQAYVLSRRPESH